MFDDTRCVCFRYSKSPGGVALNIATGLANCGVHDIVRNRPGESSGLTIQRFQLEIRLSDAPRSFKNPDHILDCKACEHASVAVERLQAGPGQCPNFTLGRK